MNRLKRVGLIFISVIFHLVAGGVIAYFWQAIAWWYWRYQPVLGVDFYNSASYVGYLARHFAPRFSGWKYIWHGGYPLELDYPTLHAYLNLPLLSVFALPQAVQAYALITCFLFLFFSYLLFVEIGKDRVLAVILTIASSFSIALYGPLVWGGSLPYFATQFFLPLILWLLIKFFNTKDKRWYFLSTLFLGISFFGHPQVALSYAGPILFFFLLFYPIKEGKFFSAIRFKRLLIYFFIALVIGYPQLRLYLGKTPMALLIEGIMEIPGKLFGGGKVMPDASKTSSAAQATVETTAEIAQFQKDQLSHSISETNPLFFIFLIAGVLIFLLSLMVRKKKKNSIKTFIFALPALWVVFYNSLFAFGIGIFHGGWYRVFWPFPLALGMLISFIWGDFWTSVKERFEKLSQKLIFNLSLMVVASLVVLIPGFLLLQKYPAAKLLDEIEIPRLRQQSSAFPDSLNVYIEKEEFENLKERLVPSWLDPNETNYRLYENDQRVNIWWNAIFDMPLVKGYIDPPFWDPSGGFYWLNIALTQSQGIDHLVETWGVPQSMAYNNTLFLLDWYSAKYIEAEHEKSDSYNPLTSYLAKSDIFVQKEKVVVPGWVQLYARKPGETGPILWHPQEEEYLTYYELMDKLVSPIVHTTNAPVIGVIGDEAAYHTLLRAFAAINLNSKMIIPLHFGKFIDDVPSKTLKEMDAVVLYSYDYKNHHKVWAKLEEYVKQGGKVFIETGSDVKQTDSINLPAKFPKELPAIFPLKMTKQADLGKSWRLYGQSSKETEEIDFEDFGPPVLNDEPWLFSQPNSIGDIKKGVKVILANDNIPLVVSWEYEDGGVIWSGMNLPYHITIHKSLEEAELLKNLLENFVSIKSVNYSNYQMERKSSQKIIVTGNKARGVFFREQYYSGWKAKVDGQKLKIYHAGPTYPGFMYVVIPERFRDGEFKVTFVYRPGFFSYFWPFLSLFTVVTLLDRIIFNGRLVVPFLLKITSPLRKKVSGWWEKEEEY